MTEEEEDLRRALPTFLTDASRRLEAIEANLLMLDNHFDQGRVQAVLGDLHTIKGDAAFVRLQQLTSVMHAAEAAAEDLTGDLRARRWAVTRLLRVVDFSRAYLKASADGSALPSAPPQLLTTDGAAPKDARREPQALENRRSTLDVDFKRLDELIATVGDLEVAWVHLRRTLLAEAVGEGASWRLDAVEALHQRLKDVTIELRMVSIDPMVQRLHRAVRDLSVALDKEVELELDVAAIRIDVQLREALTGALVHLVRNAIDHGVEASSVRLAAGKPAIGRVKLSLQANAGYLAVDLRDDGGGISQALVRERAAALGHSTQDLSEAELLDLVFTAGFSTRASSTEVSGRGIGLSAVRSALASVGGSVEVESKLGSGTAFHLRAPLSSVLFEGLIFQCGEQHWAVYLAQVESCLPFAYHSARPGNSNTGLFDWQGEAIPYLDLAAFQGRSGRSESGSIIVLRDGNRRTGVLTDRIVGMGRLVLTPSDVVLRKAKFIAGTALLPDANIGLVMDAVELARALSVVADPSKEGAA